MRALFLKTSTLAIVSLLFSACATRTAQVQTEHARELAPNDWSTPASDATITADWIRSFQDTTLDTLIEEAMQNNFGLEASLQRSNAAAAAARISGSFKYPTLGVDLRSNRQKSLVNLAPPIPATSESHSLNLSSQWELDLWQRVGSRHSAATARYEATIYDFEALKLSLSGQIAKAWFNAIEANTQYELADASAKSFETKLATLEKRYSRGLIEAFDLRLTRAQASSTRANAVNRRSQMDASIRVLETLLGRYPSGSIKTASTLPNLGSTPPASLPSSLLERRPDLLSSERNLAAAFAQNQSMQRNWLPSIVLTGSEGTLSNEFSNLLDNDFNIWSLAGNLSAPLFQSGRLSSERKQSEANYLSQIAQYKDTVLRAFREVETALRSEKDLLDFENATRTAADENIEAEKQSWNLYERGLVDITSVLDSERRAFDARSQLISIHNRRLQNRIDLHIALGGGFQE